MQPSMQTRPAMLNHAFTCFRSCAPKPTGEVVPGPQSRANIMHAPNIQLPQRACQPYPGRVFRRHTETTEAVAAECLPRKGVSSSSPSGCTAPTRQRGETVGQGRGRRRGVNTTGEKQNTSAGTLEHKKPPEGMAAEASTGWEAHSSSAPGARYRPHPSCGSK